MCCTAAVSGHIAALEALKMSSLPMERALHFFEIVLCRIIKVAAAADIVGLSWGSSHATWPHNIISCAMASNVEHEALGSYERLHPTLQMDYLARTQQGGL
jgi:hypothetical protein